MNLTLHLGSSSSSAPATWNNADNPHAWISGRSGAGKSYFLKHLLAQAAHQAHCLVLDYSIDFRNFTPPEELPYRHVSVSSPDFTLNPLMGSAGQNADTVTQQLLGQLHAIFRMGPRATLALRKATTDYLCRCPDTPTLNGLLHFISQKKEKSTGLTAATEPLELLTSLVHCGADPINLDLSSPGLTVLSFEEILDVQLRRFLIELILQAVWTQRISVVSPTCPLGLSLDKSQNLNWGVNSMAVRILREGRKFDLAGWFSSQFIQNKDAQAALGQAALQAHFRPDDGNIDRLAKSLCQGSTRLLPQYQRLVRSLRRGQFLLRQSNGRAVIVNVPAAPELPSAKQYVNNCIL